MIYCFGQFKHSHQGHHSDLTYSVAVQEGDGRFVFYASEQHMAAFASAHQAGCWNAGWVCLSVTGSLPDTQEHGPGGRFGPDLNQPIVEVSTRRSSASLAVHQVVVSGERFVGPDKRSAGKSTLTFNVV